MNIVFAALLLALVSPVLTFRFHHFVHVGNMVLLLALASPVYADGESIRFSTAHCPGKQPCNVMNISVDRKDGTMITARIPSKLLFSTSSIKLISKNGVIEIKTPQEAKAAK